MGTVADGFNEIFLAGVGAMAITGEKCKELVEQLVQKGEMTKAQGSRLKDELKEKGDEVMTRARVSSLEAAMKGMSREQREEFIERAKEIAAKQDEKEAQSCVIDVEVEEVQEQAQE